MPTDKKILVRGAVIAFGALGLLGIGIAVRPRSSLPASNVKYASELVEELMSIGTFYRGPEANPAGSEIAFTRSGSGGRRLFFLDASTGSETEFTNVNEMLRFGGYSRDGDHFLFKNLENGAEVLRFGSRKSGISHRVNGNRGLANDVVWTGSSTFCFSYSLTEDKTLYLTTLEGEQDSTEELNTGGAAVGLTPVSPRQIAFVRDADIWIADFDTRQCIRYSRLADSTISSATGHATGKVRTSLEWLNFSPETDRFLFCAGDESNWRHVFRFGKTGANEDLTQMTFGIEHSYNGKWIEHGRGFAFIGNLTNRFFLAVRPSDPRGSTNLFSDGDVIGYSVTADGKAIIATASAGAEPPGIWRYDIPLRQLNFLGGRAALTQAQPLARQERWVPSFDRLHVAYYLIPPRSLDPARSYPAVISLPPEGNQFTRAWEKYSQLFANLGVFDVAVNHRAIDGYGNLYKRQNADDSYKDVMAVYEQMKRSRSLDTSRVFLRSTSSGAAVVRKLISNYPGLWAGVIIISGEPPPQNTNLLRQTSVLLFVGKRDSALLRANQQFEEWASNAGIPVTAYYAKGTGHAITDINVDKQLGVKIAEFISAPPRVAAHSPGYHLVSDAPDKGNDSR